MTGGSQVAAATTGSIARITIMRPEKRNALSLQTIHALCTAFDEAAHDPAVRTIVLTGAGDRAFAAGADLAEIPGAMDTPANAQAYDRQVSALYRRIIDCPIPSIARLQGSAFGGGCLLALACDFRVAAPGIKISLPVSRIGLMLSELEHWLVLRQLTPARAKLLLCTGRRLTADQALAWGLVDIVAAEGTLDDAVDTLAHDIAAGAPLAVTAAKQLTDAVYSGTDLARRFAAAYDEIYTSEDLREGLAAMAEKRPPRFRGR